MIGSKKSSWMIFITLLLFAILAYLLYWRGLVSSIRFFDIDEFSYMHWTAQIARGEHMYTDFFSYFTPGFMWAYAPIFWFSGISAQVFTTGRAVTFVIFLGILASVSTLFGITRGWKWALLPAIILAFLPMPYDKFLEIRPDNLTTFLAMIGIVSQIQAMRVNKSRWWLASGLAYSASLFVLAKTAPMVAVGGFIAVLYGLWSVGIFGPYVRQGTLFSSVVHILRDRAKKRTFPPIIRDMVLFLTGLFGPWILFFLYAIVTGHFGNVWYSLTRLPFEVYKSSINYVMEPDLFFFPNASFYGIPAEVGGFTSGLIVNHVIWIFAVLFGAYRLVTPVLREKADKGHIFTEILIALMFFIQIVGYVKFFPARHTQYLIPIAVFVSYYAADGLSIFFDWLIRVGGHETLTIVLFGLAYIFITVTKDVNGPKLLVPNTMQIAEFKTLIKTIPLTSRVVDLEGRMVFWPAGYPVSSLSIDMTLSHVTRRPPTVAEYLGIQPAEYIWDGDSGRLREMSAEDLTFINDHFTPVAGWGNRLFKRNP